jgi:hypothetical protein
MLDSIKTLLTSKRAMVAVMAALLDCLILLGLDLDPALAEQLAVLVTTVASVLIGGISLSDAGKALIMPAGVGHKGLDDAAFETAVIEVIESKVSKAQAESTLVTEPGE